MVFFRVSSTCEMWILRALCQSWSTMATLSMSPMSRLSTLTRFKSSSLSSPSPSRYWCQGDQNWPQTTRRRRRLWRSGSSRGPWSWGQSPSSSLSCSSSLSYSSEVDKENPWKGMSSRAGNMIPPMTMPLFAANVYSNMRWMMITISSNITTAVEST